MSLTSWKAEHVPHDAADVLQGDAAEYEAQLYSGLLHPALARHGVRLVAGGGTVRVVDRVTRESFEIHAGTSALCRRSVECRRCALHSVVGHACDVDGRGGSRGPFLSLAEDMDALPMIAALERVLTSRHVAARVFKR